MKWILNKKNGKFEDNWIKPIYEYLKLLKDGKYTVMVEKYKKKRSTEQNSSYWLLRVQPVTDWLRDLGNDVTTEDVHYFLKSKFLGYKIKNINGKDCKILRSTTELSTMDFMAYMESIAIHFANLGLILKDPNQEDFLDNIVKDK